MGGKGGFQVKDDVITRYGGGGAGGVIISYLIDPLNQSLKDRNRKVLFYYYQLGGEGFENGSNGSLIAQNCLPGYRGAFCTGCSQGKFKEFIGQQICEYCPNYPSNPMDPENKRFKASSVPQNQSNCMYECQDDYANVKSNPFCYGRIDYMIYSFGGFVRIIIIIFILIFGLFLIQLYFKIKSFIYNKEFRSEIRLNPTFEQSDLPHWIA